MDIHGNGWTRVWTEWEPGLGLEIENLSSTLALTMLLVSSQMMVFLVLVVVNI